MYLKVEGRESMSRLESNCREQKSRESRVKSRESTNVIRNNNINRVSLNSVTYGESNFL